jgi:hypothetical protein
MRRGGALLGAWMIPGKILRSTYRRLTAVRASPSIVAELVNGEMAIRSATFDFKTKIASPDVFTLPLVAYSIAESPMPRTGVA